MIKSGQKLSEGDFFQGGTVDQYKELFQISDPECQEHLHLFLSQCALRHGYISCFISYNKLVIGGKPNTRKTEYFFKDFKQLCKNTFNISSK